MRPVFFLFRHFSLSYKLSTKCARAFAPAKSRTLTPFTALQKSIHQMRPRAHLPPPAGLSSYTPIFICNLLFLHTPLFFSSNEMHSNQSATKYGTAIFAPIGSAFSYVPFYFCTPYSFFIECTSTNHPPNAPAHLPPPRGAFPHPPFSFAPHFFYTPPYSFLPTKCTPNHLSTKHSLPVLAPAKSRALTPLTTLQQISHQIWHRHICPRFAGHTQPASTPYLCSPLDCRVRRINAPLSQ